MVSIGPDGPAFAAPRGSTVLQAALDAGVVLASSCRNGTCRTCMRRLQRGEVTHRVEWPGVSAEELEQGWFLPCVALPLADLVLESQPEAAWAVARRN